MQSKQTGLNASDTLDDGDLRYPIPKAVKPILIEIDVALVKLMDDFVQGRIMACKRIFARLTHVTTKSEVPKMLPSPAGGRGKTRLRFREAERHKDEHQRLAGELRVMQWLKDWLLEHITGFDKPLGEFLIQQDARRSPTLANSCAENAV